MRKMSGLALLGGLVVLMAYAATAAKADETAGEKSFLSKAMACNKAETRFSEIAVKQAESLKVKAYAEKMILAHKRMAKKCDDLATALNVQAAQLDKDQLGTIDGLERLKGAAFDRAYITRMVQDHEKAIKNFENEAKNGTNADLKKLCNDALPHLQEHLKEARAIADDLKK